jgi:hypothetical protein
VALLANLDRAIPQLNFETKRLAAGWTDGDEDFQLKYLTWYRSAI